jgi:hypothetical protein
LGLDKFFLERSAALLEPAAAAFITKARTSKLQRNRWIHIIWNIKVR